MNQIQISRSRVALLLAACLALAGTGCWKPQTEPGEKLREGAVYRSERMQGRVNTVKGNVKERSHEVGQVMEPVTEPVEEALQPVRDTVSPVTAPIKEGANAVKTKIKTSPISEQSEADLNKPISCRTAEQDIVTLENEKSSVLKETAAGAGSVTPIGAAVKLLGGTYADSVRVGTGVYNSDLDAKIGAIKSTCGVR